LPASARRIGADGRPEAVALIELAAGDRVQVEAGQAVPADGRIVAGQALIDESLLSGESTPRRRIENEWVLAGSLVRDGSVTIEVAEVGRATVLAGIVGMLEQARGHKPRLARVADRLAGWFVAFVLTGAAATALIWWQIDPSRMLPVVIAVLVVSCPCALALGTPVALAAAARGFARAGLLAVGGEVIERLPGITHVVFDKTGTLTDSQMHLAEAVIEAPGLERERILRLAGRLERISRHPIASAFAEFDDGAPVDGAESVLAAGVVGHIEGVDYRLGKPAWIGSIIGRELSAPASGQWLALAADGELLAWLRVAAPLRAGARQLVANLRARGLELMIASGDRRANVSALAARLGIERFAGDLAPTDKLELVRRLQADGARVAMVGDGINDAPVLAGADVSIALAEGADIARTQADLVVTGRGLGRVGQAFELAPRVVTIIRQNLAWALAYNLIALPLAATGIVAPWLAAIGMSASSLLVVANGRRAGHLPGQTAAAPAAADSRRNPAPILNPEP
ncbi:MAG TPA: cation-translocating P-type ATPase, partial [Wenzhouxiangella sp.]|nr:cation-translocating P-type ATPase [Wenzhouxiangella sp.]